MEKSLAEILGWEEGEIYEYGNKYFETKNDRLIVKEMPIGVYDDDFWVYSPLDIDFDLVKLVAEAVPINNKKYYIKHKYLKLSHSYLNENVETGDFMFYDTLQTRNWKSIFRGSDIDRLKAIGFSFEDFVIEEVCCD